MKLSPKALLIIGVITTLIIGFLIGYSSAAMRLAGAAVNLAEKTKTSTSTTSTVSNRDSNLTPEQKAFFDRFDQAVGKAIYNSFGDLDKQQKLSSLFKPKTAQAYQGVVPLPPFKDCGQDEDLKNNVSSKIGDFLNANPDPCEFVKYDLWVAGVRYDTDQQGKYAIMVHVTGKITVYYLNKHDCDWSDKLHKYDQWLFISPDGKVGPPSTETPHLNTGCSFGFPAVDNSDPSADFPRGTKECPCEEKKKPWLQRQIDKGKEKAKEKAEDWGLIKPETPKKN